MARRATRWRGRAIVTLALLAFLVVTSAVAWRRSVGIAEARAIRALETARRELETERVTLERDIREAMRSDRIVREAEQRLGLHVAGEAQLRSVRAAPVDRPAP